jgi:hypothetical protein
MKRATRDVRSYDRWGEAEWESVSPHGHHQALSQTDARVLCNVARLSLRNGVAVTGHRDEYRTAIGDLRSEIRRQTDLIRKVGNDENLAFRDNQALPFARRSRRSTLFSSLTQITAPGG